LVARVHYEEQLSLCSRGVLIAIPCVTDCVALPVTQAIQIIGGKPR
jgi:hypothetical protein